MGSKNSEFLIMTAAAMLHNELLLNYQLCIYFSINKKVKLNQ
jgi:hypothetical protein